MIISLSRPQDIRRIVVFRALQLGDMLCAIPALRALRGAFPCARIELVGLPWAREFVARYRAYLDDFIELPGMTEFPESCQAGTDAQAAEKFLMGMRDQCYDLAVQMHGSGDHSNPLIFQFGATRVACTWHDVDNPPLSSGAGVYMVRWPEQGSEIRRCAAVIEGMGIAVTDTRLELPIGRDEVREALEVMRRHELLEDEFVCIHAGARMASRRWPVERYAAVAKALADDGWRVVLTGAAGESDLVNRLHQFNRLASINLAGHTSLGALGTLLTKSRLLICNDTGISHIAAATRTPSVVIACGSDVERWAPLDRRLHHVLAQPLPCRPCMYQECPIGHPCAHAVEVEHVLRATAAQFANVRRRSFRSNSAACRVRPQSGIFHVN